MSWLFTILKIGLALLVLVVGFGLLVVLGVPLVALVVLVAIPASIIAVVQRILPIPNVPFRYHIRNVQVRKMMSLAMIASFTLVVGLFVAMLAFVNGLAKVTKNTGVPGNIIVLSDGARDEVMSKIDSDVGVENLPKDVQDAVARDKSGDQYLASKEVYVVVNQIIENRTTEGGPSRRFVAMRGVFDESVSAQVHNLTLQSGRWFKRNGVQKLKDGETAYEVVLGNGVAQTFGEDKSVSIVGPGEVLSFGGRKWYVVGVMAPSSATFNSEIWTTDNYVMENFGRRNAYSTFVVRVRDESIVEALAKKIKNFEGGSFQAMPEPQYYENLSQTNQQFFMAILVIAFILALGGVLAVMIIMFAAINQRAKDIGVLRILGFSRWQILLSFLLETVVIAAIGGLIGCVLGYFADGVTANSVISGRGGGFKSVVFELTVTPMTLLAGMMLALIMGAVGGLVPSLTILRLKPLETLR